MQRLMAFACLAAGVFVLAGPGWGLLAVGAAVWVRDDRAQAWLRARLVQVRQLRQSSVRMPRRVSAMGSMAVCLVLVPVGALAAFGFGVALMVAGALAGTFSLITGQGA